MVDIHDQDFHFVNTYPFVCYSYVVLPTIEVNTKYPSIYNTEVVCKNSKEPDGQWLVNASR